VRVFHVPLYKLIEERVLAAAATASGGGYTQPGLQAAAGAGNAGGAGASVASLYVAAFAEALQESAAAATAAPQTVAPVVPSAVPAASAAGASAAVSPDAPPVTPQRPPATPRLQALGSAGATSRPSVSFSGLQPPSPAPAPASAATAASPPAVAPPAIRSAVAPSAASAREGGRDASVAAVAAACEAALPRCIDATMDLRGVTGPFHLLSALALDARQQAPLPYTPQQLQLCKGIAAVHADPFHAALCRAVPALRFLAGSPIAVYAGPHRERGTLALLRDLLQRAHVPFVSLLRLDVPSPAALASM